jgi:hypothetical protein
LVAAWVALADVRLNFDYWYKDPDDIPERHYGRYAAVKRGHSAPS